MAEEAGSQYIIQVAVDAAGVGPALQEVQSQAEASFADLNAKLATLGEANPFARLLTATEQETAGVSELTASLLGARTAMISLNEAQGKIGSNVVLTVGGLTGEQLSGYMGQLERAIGLQQEFNTLRETGAALPINLPTSLAGSIAEQEAQLKALVAAQQEARQLAAGFGTGNLDQFRTGGVLNAQQATQAAAALEAQAAQLRLAAAQATTNPGAGAVQSAEAAAIKKELAAVGETDALERQGTLYEQQQAQLQRLAGLSDERLAAELRVEEVLQRNAALNERGATALQVTTANRQLLAAQGNLNKVTEGEAAAAQAAPAGGGGFFGGFGGGLTGNRGGGSDFSPENLGAQIGQVAKYIYLYEAFIKIDQAIKETIKLTKEYQDGLVHLEIALLSIRDATEQVKLSQNDINGLISIGAQAGVQSGESLEIAARGIQAYHSEIHSTADAVRVANATVQEVTQGAVISADKFTDVQTRLISVTKEFGLGAEGQARVLDAATNANRRFGTSIKEILDGLSQVAGLAVQSGFSVEQLTNVIGIITANTGLTGGAAAGDLKRVIAGQGSPAFTKAIESVGVSTNQSFEQQLEQLGTKFNTLTQAQQQNLITTLGGRRAAEALIPLLQQMGDLQAANAYSLANQGAAQQEFNKRQDTFAGVLRQISGLAKQLAVDLGRSGLGAGFGLVLDAVIPLLRVIDGLVQAWDALPSPIRDSALALLEMAGALKLVNALASSGIVTRIAGSVIGIPGRIGGAVQGVRTAAGVGEVALAGEGAGTVGLGLARLGGVIGGLAAAAGPAAIAIGVLDAAIVANKAAELGKDLSKVSDVYAAANKASSPQELLDAASNVGQLEQDLRSKSKGFNGAIADFLNGDTAGRTIKSLEDFRKELAKEATGIQQAATAGNGPTIFGSTGIESVDSLTSGLKTLSASGLTAHDILIQLSEAIGITTGAAQRGVTALAPPSSVAVTGGALAYASGLFASGIVPGSIEALLVQANNAPDAKPGPGLSATGYGKEKDPNALFATAIVDLSGKARDALVTQVQQQIGDKTFLTKADQLVIADDVVAAYKSSGIGDPKTLAGIRALVLANFSKKALADFTGGNVDAFRDPVLQTATADALAQQGTQDISNASARGADSTEIARVSKAAEQRLQTFVNQLTKGGVEVTPELEQKLREARKTAFDAFAKRVEELRDIALAGASAGQKDAINQQVKALEAIANLADPGLLPTDFTLTTLPGLLKAITSGLKAQDNSMIKIQTELTNARIAVLQAQADSLYELANPQFQSRGDKIETQIDNLRRALKAFIDGLGKNDPSYGTGSSSSSSTSTAPSDTAAQIAAARRLAGIYPGAPVETAAAEVQRARADLDAMTKHDVAFYNALASLHKAEQDYRNAVLEAAHVSRELNIDLTNPVAVAAEALRTARAKLVSDQRNGADQATLNQDRLAVRQDQSALENTKFQQNLDAARTNFELGSITRAQYLSYLDRQRDNLLKIAHRTFQEQQELNQVNELIKQTTDSLSGQFNLGQIRLPTPYEVRRQLSGGGGLAGASAATSNVTIYISGADNAKVQAILATYIGTPVLGSATLTSSPKV